MNLTETQMDRITDAFSKGVDISPTRNHSRSPSKFADAGRERSSPCGHFRQYSRGNDDLGSHDGNSTTFSDLMPRRSELHGSTHSLAERRRRATPAPILVHGQHRAQSVPRRVEMQPIHDDPSPLDSPMMYMIDPNRQSREVPCDPLPVFPQRVGHSKPTAYVEDGEEGMQYFADTPYLEAYGQWADVRTYRETKPLAHQDAKVGGLEGYTHHSKSTADTSRQEQQRASPSRPRPPQLRSAKDVESPMFSPFPFYFQGQGLTTEKKGEKTMIGENGWLERPGETTEKSKRGAKKTGLLDGIKKIAKDMSEQYSSTRRAQHPATEASGTTLAISLSAREQSLLYGELEFHLGNALNTYITVQLEKGRLLTDRLHKISDHWLQLGRPRVLGFRYDLETQLEILSLHVQDFVFSGRRQGNRTEICGLLDAMKINSRAMRVRTFCQPDSVVAKQLVDSQSLFNLIGVGREEDLALTEIAQFFKVCIEREKQTREKEARRARPSAFDHSHRHEARHGRGSRA
ncbi:uncharacterized protein J7T54_003415 [Emericellopsis cladophorae]|uniref:Uncharacterized protein n=1 Tax=Emericellopsis cladophorae TaxID=2686198 RepID=A0A9P9Y291_9HYPO|nr:uncharacterized protein J7T54_003415 [Emericellopsis cladophorae]KAI6781996.1 hypothetical protein J7T54_003415 [Emericellopsis cladophorae]